MNQNGRHSDIAQGDRGILRQLARRVRDLAQRPIEDEKREHWFQHNALGKTRPLIFCDPEHGWTEIIRPDELKCKSTQARRWEMGLRREIFWGEQIRDDRVILPVFDVHHVFRESDWGMKAVKIGGEEGGSYILDPPLKSYKELDKLSTPTITVDFAASNHLFHLAEDILGDILEVRLRTIPGTSSIDWWVGLQSLPDVWWWSLGMTETLMSLRGMTEMMYDMLDNPEDLHRLMAFLRDGYLIKLDFLEKEGLLSLNNRGDYVGSGGFGWTNELPQPDFTRQVRTIDMWGFSESQETTSISPRMFGEFIFPYQLPVLERFGLNCYGCCEPLEKRWQFIQNIPRLRRVSVSPWSNINKMAEILGDRYIFSMKARPSDLAMPFFDEDRIRLDLRQALHTTRDCVVEIIMKDNHTIGNDPRRVVRWVEIAMEEANKL